MFCRTLIALAMVAIAVAAPTGNPCSTCGSDGSLIDVSDNQINPWVKDVNVASGILNGGILNNVGNNDNTHIAAPVTGVIADLGDIDILNGGKKGGH